MAHLMLAPASASHGPAARSPAPDLSLQWLGLFTKQTLEERRVSASTVEAYTLDLTTLSGWAAGQKKDLLGLTTADLNRYINQRLAQGTHPSTLARHLCSYRRFYAFLLSHGVLAANPAAAVDGPEVIRSEPRLVPDEVLGVVLRAPRRRYQSPASGYRAHRDHALVCMLYGTSLAISDIRLLLWQQIDEQGHVIRVPLRNREVRSCAVDVRLLVALKALRGRAATPDVGQADTPYCFPTAAGLPMTRQGLYQVVRKWAQECGLEEIVTPSGLRQTGLAHHAGQRRVRPVLTAD